MKKIKLQNRPFGPFPSILELPVSVTTPEVVAITGSYCLLLKTKNVSRVTKCKDILIEISPIVISIFDGP